MDNVTLTGEASSTQSDVLMGFAPATKLPGERAAAWAEPETISSEDTKRIFFKFILLEKSLCDIGGASANQKGTIPRVENMLLNHQR